MRVAVVGGGPVGVYAAYWASQNGFEVTLFEKNSFIGGQLVSVYPHKEIFDLPGRKSILATDFAKGLNDQLKGTRTKVFLKRCVTGIEADEGLLKVRCDKDIYQFDGAFLAVGGGETLPKKLKLQNSSINLDEYVSYFVKNLSLYKNKDVCVLGGGDSALDNALMINKVANSVTLIHRRRGFRALEGTIKKVIESDIRILTSYSVEDICFYNGTALKLRSLSRSGDIMVPFDKILVNFGLRKNLGIMKNWGLNVKRNGILVDSQMKTNLDKVVAVGDAVIYPGKTRRMVSGFGEVPMALQSLQSMIKDGI